MKLVITVPGDEETGMHNAADYVEEVVLPDIRDGMTSGHTDHEYHWTTEES